MADLIEDADDEFDVRRDRGLTPLQMAEGRVRRLEMATPSVPDDEWEAILAGHRAEVDRLRAEEREVDA